MPHDRNVLATVRGIVRHGDGRGRKLGYPTANIFIHQPLRDGVYISFATWRGHTYPSITFIGAAKTFHKRQRWLETHFLDFNTDIYSEWVSVRLLAYLRGNKRFDSVADLIQAMRKDESHARAYFNNHVYRNH